MPEGLLRGGGVPYLFFLLYNIVFTFFVILYRTGRMLQGPLAASWERFYLFLK
jgi:hypothetical protein